MSKKDDGGPAFPQLYCVNCNDAMEVPNGMTLRDWFAGQALAGALADSTMQSGATSLAKWAYSQADAMLAERAKE